MVNKFSSLDRYYKEAGEYPLLSKEQENQLSKKARSGDEDAVKELVQSNLRLVVKIAQDFQGRGLDLQDLISEGNIGLCTAARKFDPEKGAKFSYYSSFWIRQNILRAIANTGRLIRVPVCTLDKYFKINSFISSYKKEHSREPSKALVAKKFNLTKKRLMQILESTDHTIPLDAKIGDDGETKLHEVITEEENLRPDVSLDEREKRQTILSALQTLNQREREIIVSRFDLDGRGKKSLETLGQEYNVTRERVRQIQNKALASLKFNLEKSL
tara:strand:- start:152 stop:967 length:816 start_codon:yes stop_codon:yes gene_type:complete